MTPEDKAVGELDEILEAVRKGGYYDANPNERQSDYFDKDVAKERLQTILSQERVKARIEEVDLAADHIFNCEDAPCSYPEDRKDELEAQLKSPGGSNGL